jgi:hypothetical protein
MIMITSIRMAAIPPMTCVDGYEGCVDLVFMVFLREVF